MQEILKRIQAQQRAMGYTDFIEASTECRLKYIRDISLSIVVEVGEFLDEVPYKPWKRIEDQPFNEVPAALEICDIIVFAIVLYVSLNPSISLEEAMEQTLAKIDNRIKTGYGQKE